MLRPIALLFTLLLQAGLLLAAQHSGLVRSVDQPIPGASVTAIQGGAKLVALTDDWGQYEFEFTPGVWRLEVEIFGFQKAVRQIEIKDQFPTTLDWILQIQSRDGSKEATPPDTAGGFKTLSFNQTAEPAAAATIPAAPAEAALAEAQPEAPVSSANEAFLVSGSLSRGLDEKIEEKPDAEEKPRKRKGETGSTGVTGYAVPPPGAFSIGKSGKMERVAAGPKRARGRTRSVTAFGNKRPDPGAIRGTASFTLRNSALDARPYSLSGQTVDKPSYAQARFSFSAGGQLRIPKIIDSERAFFFFNYSGGRSRQPYQTMVTVPSPAERQGDFSDSMTRWPVQIFDPATAHTPFPGNQIPKSRWNPAAGGLGAFIPLPNLPGRVQNYEFGTSINQNNDTYGTRFNQSVGRRDRLDVSFNRNTRHGTSAYPFGFIDQTEGAGFNSSAGYTHNFGPRRIMTLRWNFSHNRSWALPYFANKRNVADELGIQGTPDDPVAWGPPNISFTNFASLSDGTASLRRDQTSAVQPSFLIVLRQHNITVGGEFRRAQINSRVYSNARGSYSFSGLLTSDFDAKGNPLPGTGYDFADFLLGFPQSSSLRFGSENTYFRDSIYAAYAQDDWRVRKNLTVNLGLRYEYFPPFTEKRDQIANLDIAPNFTGVAVVLPGKAGPWTGKYSRGLIDPDKNNLSPRIGFAWRPFGPKTTQIRGGYSIFYNGSIYNEFPTRMASQPPFAKTASLSTSNARRLTLQNGFASTPSSTITNTFAVDRYYQTGYAQTFSLSLQQGLPHALVMDIGYLGTKGTRLDVQRLPNRAMPGSPLTAEQRRQIGNALGFTFDTSCGNSIFHALQIRLMRRYMKGISGNLMYQWSKSIDNVSTYGGGGVVVAQNDRDLRAERGVSSFNQPHSITASYTLDSPVGENGVLRGGGWKMKALANWSLSGSVSAAAGTPLTARVLGNLANSGGTGVIGTGRADASGESVDGGRFFNLGAFIIPPSGRFGNAGRNTIPGPFRFSMNASFGRSFRLGSDGRRSIELRVDASNWANNVSYTGLGTVVNALTYGLPTSAMGMRTVNSTLRVKF